jgi:hypothetical protein
MQQYRSSNSDDREMTLLESLVIGTVTGEQMLLCTGTTARNLVVPAIRRSSSDHPHHLVLTLCIDVGVSTQTPHMQVISTAMVAWMSE